MTIGNLSCHPQPEVSDPKLAQTNTNILLTREAFGDEGWYNISFHQSNFNRILLMKIRLKVHNEMQIYFQVLKGPCIILVQTFQILFGQYALSYLLRLGHSAF